MSRKGPPSAARGRCVPKEVVRHAQNLRHADTMRQTSNADDKALIWATREEALKLAERENLVLAPGRGATGSGFAHVYSDNPSSACPWSSPRACPCSHASGKRVPGGPESRGGQGRRWEGGRRPPRPGCE